MSRTIFFLVAFTVGVAYSCKMMCPMNYEPVCGTDGHTYSTVCEMEALSCRAKKTVNVEYEGECRKVDSENDCPIVCTMEYAPVCGTDGKTYSNECGLNAEACRTKKSINVDYEGECIEVDSENDCPIMCTLEFAPVCGTDGKTYSNECGMDVEACRTKQEITVSHIGRCSYRRANRQH